jgi:hypothetical protein
MLSGDHSMKWNGKWGRRRSSRRAVPYWTEWTMRQRTRRKLDAALKAKIALEAL